MKMAGMNVLMNIPPEKYPGYELNMAPLMAEFCETVFGPRLAPRIFTDIRKKLTLEPQFENRILESGMPLPVHPMDEDVQHLQEHMKQFQETGDIHGTLREHMLRHQMQMQQKQQGMMQPRQSQGGGGGARSGGKATGPRPNGQGPPGMVHRDQMQGAPRPRGGAM
jgi:hypothetical protein